LLAWRIHGVWSENFDCRSAYQVPYVSVQKSKRHRTFPGTVRDSQHRPAIACVNACARVQTVITLLASNQDVCVCVMLCFWNIFVEL
jgi:hypothetical protein